ALTWESTSSVIRKISRCCWVWVSVVVVDPIEQVARSKITPDQKSLDENFQVPSWNGLPSEDMASRLGQGGRGVKELSKHCKYLLEFNF
ncbi:MAG: hypothetical protein V3S71_00260, partial [Acidobacteriota bacterium]